jgi:hypothetical protein
LSVRES